MAEEIGFENGRNSNFQGLVTLTLDPAIRHTVVHHSSTSTYVLNFIQIEESFCGRTDVRTYGHTDVRTDGHFPPLILLGRLLEVDLKSINTRHIHAHTQYLSFKKNLIKKVPTLQNSISNFSKRLCSVMLSSSKWNISWQYFITLLWFATCIHIG